MALDMVSHFFDQYREDNGKGDTILQSIREGVSKSYKNSALGKYDKYCEVPDEEFKSWLDALFDHEGAYGLTDEQRHEVRQQLTLCLKNIKEKSCVACWKYWLRSDLKPVSVLLIVDVQNDFISGSLALKDCPAGEDGEEVVPVIQHLLSQKLFSIVAYSFDWHPSDHCSFIDNVSLCPLHPTSAVTSEQAQVFDTVIYDREPLIPQRLWPRHCVMNTWGSELHKDLKPPGDGDITVKKASNPLVDSYSAFWDNGDGTQTLFLADLLGRGVTDVFICGLAFDICAKATALDAAETGFRTHVIADACRGVTPEGIAEAKELFQKNGIIVLDSSEVGDAIRDGKKQT